MNTTWMSYGIILVVLFLMELIYFRIADKFNIIDKPNLRSSHTKIVLRGGGIIFTIALWLWSVVYGFQYPWMLAGVTLAAAVSFIDDIHSLSIKYRLVVQFIAMFLVFQDVIPLLSGENWVVQSIILFIAMVVAVWATNLFNFMDGINGITGGYSLAMLIPLMIKNEDLRVKSGEGFMDGSLLVVIGLSLLVFCFFNFRTKAKCFAGDVGSIGIATFLVFCMGRLMQQTGDLTWIILFLIYGVDSNLTILHRLMLHENIGKPHRKHAYQLLANELKMSHVTVSIIYMVLQLAVSLGFIYLCPDTLKAHLIYLIVMALVAIVGYVLFMKKYYHLHEEYLEKIKK